MLLVRHSIPEATWSDFWIGKLNENFITNLLLTDTHSNKVKETEFDRNRDFLIRNLIEHCSASKIQRVSNEQLPSMQNILNRTPPPKKIDSYPREKERSLGIKKKMIIVYTIIMAMILVIVKKKISYVFFNAE